MRSDFNRAGPGVRLERALPNQFRSCDKEQCPCPRYRAGIFPSSVAGVGDR
jgi:hypothetical protein